ncbi:MAG: hypothetical protein HY047_01045 [Acidobacteria bacterium]|nr:hypothetical protein [Acidobacteriota bacterium]
MTRVVFASLVVLTVLSVAGLASAQEPKSSALAKELASALEAVKLDSIAAKDPSAPDTFVAALYFPGVQLLVISAKYTAPQLLNERLAKKEYRDTYIDLSSASVPASKVFVEDLGADGLKAKHEENTGADTYEVAGVRTVFDGDWKRQQVSEADYAKTFSTADARYAQLLTALIAQVKKDK